MQNKDKDDGIEDSPPDMLLVILLEGASKEVVTPSSIINIKFNNVYKVNPHVIGLNCFSVFTIQLINLIFQKTKCKNINYIYK